MSKVINKWWFTTFGGHCIGIVKTLDEITGEEKFRIGIGEGLDEKIYTMSGLAKEFNINRHTLYSRLKNGWSIEKALTPPRKYEVLNEQK